MKTIQPEFLFSKPNLRSSLKNYLKPVIVLFFALTCFVNNSRSQTGEMLALDGNDDFVEIGDIIPNGSYTKEAWINANSWGGSIGSILSGDNTAFWAPNGRLRAGHDINNIFNDVQASVANQMLTGTWYHVAVTYNSGTNELILYQNGVIVDQGPASLPFTETSLYLGAFRANRPIDPNNPQSPFDGSFDEVRIWGVVRTQAEIQASMNCILTGDEYGLLAYYDFDQGIADGNNPTEDVLLDRRDACVPNNGAIFNMNLGGAGGSNWSAPGAGVTGSCGGTFVNINLVGNSVCITDGDATPSAGDFTDFQGGTQRTFTIQNTGTATLNIASVTFTGANAGDFSVTTPPAASVLPGGSTTFTVTLTPTANATYNAVVNISSDDQADEALYTFAITTTFTTLPVNLMSFTVTKLGTQAKLNWQTATETNNAGFHIERSFDARTWTSIAFVAGAGSTTTVQNYTYTDPNPQKGVNYYRLRQVDDGGQQKYSEVRPVTFASEAVLIYPVPTRDKVVIELPDNTLIGTQAVISGQDGRFMKQFTINKLQQEISLANYPAGIYYMRLEDGRSYKLVRQ